MLGGHVARNAGRSMARFVLQLFVGVVFMAVGVAAFNAITDPSGYFHLRRGADPHSGYRVHADPRLAKPIGAALLHPNTLIAGTSRVALGFSPQLPQTVPEWGLVYNFGIPGVQMRPLYEQLRPLLREPSLQRVVLALDYGMFFITRERRDVHAPLPDRWVAGQEPADWVWMTRTLLLSDAMLAASLVPRLPGASERRRSDLLGNADEGPQRHRVQRIGHRQITLKLERFLVAIWANSTQSREKPYQRHLEAFAQLLDDACRQSVQVRALINPVHVRQMELLHEMGLSEAYRDWKRDLVRRMEPFVEAGCASPLMDFSGVSPVTTERFPALGDRETRMHGWWESSHFTHAVGDKILDRLTRVDGPVTDGFGLVVDGDVLEHMAADWQRYREEHQVELRDVPGLDGHAKLAQH
jgi:hypothetical protein